MDVQAVLKYMDDLVFAQTGQHLDSLRVAILKGVINGKKYTQIAEEYNCSAGHAKDEAYELWQIFSEALGEDLNKSNFRATIERLGVANAYSNIVNPVQIGNINLCPNPSQSPEENLESIIQETAIPYVKDNTTVIEIERQKTKLESVPRLVKLGLTAEQIASALGLSLEEVQKCKPTGE
jgi:DNA-directed RNA polymerase specialized sigma24 family protein